ncbi:MAG: hypothetical protein HKN20_15290 [Gemmatimonadetes bacterium]|nr:hypothetical protein [Gemmatimonadota bacterium]
MIPSIRPFFSAVCTAALCMLLVHGCAVPEYDPDLTEEGASVAEEGVPVAETEASQISTSEDEGDFQGGFQSNKNATVTTDIDTYDIRNIAFDTALGYGRARTLLGFYLNTRLEIEIKYISSFRVIDRVTLTDALSVDSRYDMVEEQDLDYIFRLELKKTTGERIEYIVRINSIRGQLVEGGSISITGDELQTLRKVVFY